MVTSARPPDDLAAILETSKVQVDIADH
jgi:hypothetical protein